MPQYLLNGEKAKQYPDTRRNGRAGRGKREDAATHKEYKVLKQEPVKIQVKPRVETLGIGETDKYLLASVLLALPGSSA